MELHHGWGSCLARRSVWTRSMHQGASVPSPRTAAAPQVHSAPAFSTGDNPTLWCTMHSPLPKCNVLGINNVWGISVCDLPLLQLSVTSRMVAEKWPHKKAIKEHKGSESRAQCDISRKWDICVHGARPTSDMFTRVQGGRCNPDRMWDVTLGKRLQSVDNTATRDSTARKGLSGRWRRGKANDWGSSTCGGQG